MFKKVIVIDAKAHLMGRLASYIAKSLLAGSTFPIQARGSLWWDAKRSTSPAPFLETKPNSMSSSEKDSSPTLDVLSFITGLPLACSGELYEAWSLTKLPAELPPWADSKCSMVYPPPTTLWRDRSSQMPWEQSSSRVSGNSACLAIFPIRLAGATRSWSARWRTNASNVRRDGTSSVSLKPTNLAKPWMWKRSRRWGMNLRNMATDSPSYRTTIIFIPPPSRTTAGSPKRRGNTPELIR